jgi:hypothetical protein
MAVGWEIIAELAAQKNASTEKYPTRNTIDRDFFIFLGFS